MDYYGHPKERDWEIIAIPILAVVVVIALKLFGF